MKLNDQEKPLVYKAINEYLERRTDETPNQDTAVLRAVLNALAKTLPCPATNRLTTNQVVALKNYADLNGRNWKSKLQHDWVNGHSVGELQQVRNQFGPAWLVRFNLALAVHRETLKPLEKDAP